MTEREIERALLRFEGLVHETARQIVAGGVEMEHEDVAQMLRLTVWKAVIDFDARHRRGLPLRRYVFMCVANRRKDIETRRPRRYNSSIDEIRARSNFVDESQTIADWFDSRYLCTQAEQAFAEVDEAVELPADLTEVERQVIALRLDGHLLFEIERELGLSRSQRERVMRSVRDKLAPFAVAA